MFIIIIIIIIIMLLLLLLLLLLFVICFKIMFIISCTGDTVSKWKSIRIMVCGFSERNGLLAGC